MGSKQDLLPFIINNVSSLKFSTALDAFSGSGCVGYGFKRMDKRVIANDFLKFAYHLAAAMIQNNGTTIDKDDLSQLVRKAPNAPTFVRDMYTDIYFPEEDCAFLDSTYSNIQNLKSPLKKSLALSALCRAAMKKRPRGIFTFVGRKGWDGRRDLRLTMRQQFLIAIEEINRAVFSNSKPNRAYCGDIFDIAPEGIDLVYIDTPYISPHSDSDYTRRYHFVEGLCTYWNGIEIQVNTKTKKFRSYPTAFSSKHNVITAFARLFSQFRNSILVVSYGSNGIPSKEDMLRLLKSFKSRVHVNAIAHKYSFGNHGHKVGNNNNNVIEYLFIAT